MEGILYRVAPRMLARLLALVVLAGLAKPAFAMEAVLFRGAGDFSFIGEGLTFSNGMDRLGEKLTAAGVPATVYRWQAVDWAYRDLMKKRPDAVMIMGHSMGALSTVTLAAKLKGSGIRVAYIGTIDIPGPTAIAPSNVEVAENFYHAFPVYGLLSGGSGFRGKLSNTYVFGQIHITMDKSDKVHNAALAFVGSRTGLEPSVAAFADPAADGASDVVEQVDKVLTATATGETTQVVTSQFAEPPQTVPLPTPSPTRAMKVAALPKIE
jgi:pimeloyl-ACP methyl ester carboxylesterase